LPAEKKYTDVLDGRGMKMRYKGKTNRKEQNGLLFQWGRKEMAENQFEEGGKYTKGN
jgi:hypothetical protein